MSHLAPWCPIFPRCTVYFILTHTVYKLPSYLHAVSPHIQVASSFLVFIFLFLIFTRPSYSLPFLLPFCRYFFLVPLLPFFFQNSISLAFIFLFICSSTPQGTFVFVDGAYLPVLPSGGASIILVVLVL